MRMSCVRILTIEDDPDIAHLLRLDLTGAGYQVLHADTGTVALTLARYERPALILLDLGLPDVDGGTVLKRLRRICSVPIIVLTARDDVREKVRLMELGANDYVTKPFHLSELLARIQVQLRAQKGHVLTAGRLVLDPQRHQVRHGETELRLSPTEFRILKVLMQQPGRVVSHKDLVEQVWEGQLSEDSTVLVAHMSNLRAKLRHVNGYSMLRTVHGVGYSIHPEA